MSKYPVQYPHSLSYVDMSSIPQVHKFSSSSMHNVCKESDRPLTKYNIQVPRHHDAVY